MKPLPFGGSRRAETSCWPEAVKATYTDRSRALSTAVYPHVNQRLALAIGDEFEAEQLGTFAWEDSGSDVGLSAGAFARRRGLIVDRVASTAAVLRDEAVAAGWHDPVVDQIVAVVDRRAERMRAQLRAA